MVLGAAAGLAGLTAVEPLGAAWRGLIEGRLQSLELGGKLRREAGLAKVVAEGYLGRSASCLTRLDMRCPPLAPSLTSNLRVLSSYAEMAGPSRGITHS